MDGLLAHDGGGEASGVVGSHGGSDFVEGLFGHFRPTLTIVLEVADIFESRTAERFDTGVAEVVRPEVFGEGELADLGDFFFEERF